MVRRWSYVTYKSSIFARNVIMPAAAKMFKASLKIKTISKSQTRLIRKRYFLRKIKNSLTMFVILAANWACGVITLKKGSALQHYLNSAHFNLNIGLCVMCAPNLHSLTKNIFYHNPGIFSAKKTSLQPKVPIAFPPIRSFTPMMSAHYRRVLTTLLLFSLFRLAP